MAACHSSTGQDIEPWVAPDASTIGGWIRRHIINCNFDTNILHHNLLLMKEYNRGVNQHVKCNNLCKALLSINPLLQFLQTL